MSFHFNFISLEKHVANVCSSGFYWLRQLQRVRRSLDTDSMKTLVHAFVMSRVDYCRPNAILAGSPRYITDKLQRLLNAAARLITATRKFDHGPSLLLHDELHWLDIQERVHYKLGVTVHRCLHDKAPNDWHWHWHWHGNDQEEYAMRRRRRRI